MATVVSKKEQYSKDVQGALRTDLGLDNVWMVPRIEKIIVNAGIGKADKESTTEITEAFRVITGQEPLRTKSRQSIAGFKLREGQNVGLKVTLRGQRMWDFLERVVNIALPRVRDFQGITATSVDHAGNINIGIKEHTVFPEIVAENARQLYSFQVTVVSTAKTQKQGDALFRALGFPLQPAPVKTKKKKSE